MAALTPDRWAQDFTELRPLVLEEFPDLDRQRLEAARGDWDRLVEEVQRATNWSGEAVRQRLRAVEIDDGEGADEGGPASVAQLRFDGGFTEREQDRVRARLEKLNRRLKRFPAEATELTIGVKDRDTTSQKVTLECSVPNFARFVVTSQESDLKDALMDVREDLWRQIDDAVNKRKEGAR
ncbi:MAG: hypothetical protein ACR2MA_01890 [Egibacteraceae bacterium]